MFSEIQRLPQRRLAVALAIPPCCMLGLLIWQVPLHHSWGKQPMSNGSIAGWTVFLWIIYFRLITVRLVTEVRDAELVVSMRGFWRARRIMLSDIRSADVISYDPERDYGGYGIRSTRNEKAYIAGGTRGVRIRLANGAMLVIGSQRAGELADILRRNARLPSLPAASHNPRP